ncbi:MAG: hypothetical protein CMK37_08915 [Porticoccaceae bacterium]|nr:hypothetical protein [Porticoccaceae bacterium]
MGAVLKNEYTLGGTPKQVVEEFISAFNSMDNNLLDQIWASPCVFMIGNQTNVFERYSHAVDFNNILESGWKYTKINWIEDRYESEDICLLRFNFSRFSEEEEELNNYTVSHLLRMLEDEWKISALIMDETSGMSGVASR